MFSITAVPAIFVAPVTTSTQIEEFCALAPAIAPSQLSQGQVDLHWLAYREGRVAARCSLWWSAAPLLPGQRVGCIGHYAARDRTAAAELLATACARLLEAGCTFAVGPLDGSTFRSYRLVTQRAFHGLAAHPPFLLEPDNPDEWREDFEATGFQVWSEYLSAIAPLVGPDPQLESRTASLAAQGIHLRDLDPAIFDETSDSQAAFAGELARIYPLIMTAFANNPLFTPISYPEFAAQYAPIRKLLSPGLATLAERDGELVGLLFALPDFAQAQRGERIDTVILKTLAVLPSLAGIGLGSLLSAQVHTNAYQAGFRWAVHALMHVANRSRRISAHRAQPFRAYSLFGRQLAPGITERSETLARRP